MAVDYFVVFGAGNPSDNTGLSPTFTTFKNAAGGATTAPAISEVGSEGIYTFNYDPQGAVAFVIDGATTGLAASDRYVVGSLDVDDALSSIVIGTSSDAIGDSSTDPTSLFGFVQRIQKWLEGDSTYTKSTGVWAVTEPTGATTLSSKTIADNGSTITKT